jgi:hypothetical protein
MAKSKESKKKEEKKKEETTIKTDEIVGATIGAIIGGLVMGGSMYVLLFKDKPISSIHKFLVGTVIVLLNMIVPALIGWYAGSNLDFVSIITNIIYYFGIYVLLFIMIRSLIRPNRFDTGICIAIFVISFLISMEFGLYNDGSLSKFWIIILFIFSFLLAGYYYFGYIVKTVKNIETQWSNYKPNNDIDTNIDGLNPVDTPSMLLFDINSYKDVLNKVFTIINPTTVPDIVPTVEKAETVIDIQVANIRHMLLICIGLILAVITVISIIIYIFITVFGKKSNSGPTSSILFGSSLEVNFYLLLFFCLLLIAIKTFIESGIDKYAPQFKPEALEAQLNSITDIAGIKQLLPTNFASLFNSGINSSSRSISFQKGGKKINRTNKLSESYLKLKI